MLSRNGRHQFALGGLIFAGGVAAAAAYWWALPPKPEIPARRVSEAPQRDYQPGGARCSPKQITALPISNQADERARCSEAREQHRAQLYGLQEQRRANDIAEWNLRLAARQASYGLAQTVATIAAFVAAAVAAGIAWRAMVWAKAAAKDTKRSADAAHHQLVAVRDAERAYIATFGVLMQEPDRSLAIVAGNPGRTQAHVLEVRYTAADRIRSGPGLKGVLLLTAESDVMIAPARSEKVVQIAPIDDASMHLLGIIIFEDVYHAKRRQHFRYDRQPDGRWLSSGGRKWNAAKEGDYRPGA